MLIFQMLHFTLKFEYLIMAFCKSNLMIIIHDPNMIDNRSRREAMHVILMIVSVIICIVRSNN
jgi:hypothetical protein